MSIYSYICLETCVYYFHVLIAYIIYERLSERVIKIYVNGLGKIKANATVKENKQLVCDKINIFQYALDNWLPVGSMSAGQF